jgi:hypothetical protein
VLSRSTANPLNCWRWQFQPTSRTAHQQLYSNIQYLRLQAELLRITFRLNKAYFMFLHSGSQTLLGIKNTLLLS